VIAQVKRWATVRVVTCGGCLDDTTEGGFQSERPTRRPVDRDLVALNPEFRMRP
jgi:hypothetical protein